MHLCCYTVWFELYNLKCSQPVEVCLPYHRTKRREVVVRRFDGQSWSTLPTDLRRGSESHSSHPGGRPARVKHKPPISQYYYRWNQSFFSRSIFISITNCNINVEKNTHCCTCSWHAAQWASFPGLWLCPVQWRTFALLHQLEPCWCPALTLELSSTSLQTPPYRSAPSHYK